jgi:hypothetical protein
MSDFERINGPRVERLIEIIEMIRKSAKSQKVTDEAVNALLSRAFAGSPADTSEPESAPQAPAPAVKRPSEVMEWADVPKLVASIPDQLLGSVATQLTHRLCERFEDQKSSS